MRRNIETPRTHPLINQDKEESLMAQLDQNLCRRKTKQNKKKKEWKEKERKREMSSNVLQPNQTKPVSHKYPSATPQKIPSSSPHCLKNNYVSPPIYVGFLGLCLGQNFLTHRKQETENLLTPSLSLLSLPLSSFSISCPPLFLSISHFPFPITHHIFFSLFYLSYLFPTYLQDQIFLFFIFSLEVLYIFCDLMSKKMKRVVMDLSSHGVSVDAKDRLKHQTLIQDYQELKKETEATRHKLETTKQRKLTLLAEVRFLRRRYKFLLKNKSSTPAKERELVQARNLETKKKTNMKGRIYSKKEATQRNLPPVFNLNQKGRVYMGKEAALQNTIPILNLNQKETLHGRKETALYSNRSTIADLNHKGRMYRGREAATLGNPMTVPIDNPNERIYIGNGAVVRNPAPIFDLNPRESNLSGKEHVSQSRAPVFDLNQISREEEEIEDTREPLKFEDPMKGSIRGGGDEPTNDLKLSVCRNIGDGSSRAGKRKISWQDPVALRV